MTMEEMNNTQEASHANGLNSNASDANKVQESESQDNAGEDDCIIGLDIADDWDDEDKDKERRRSWDRARGKRASREREKERERDRDRDFTRRRRSRSRGRRSRSRGRRSRSNERSKREPSRRDPSKSNKDIEQDKLRAKKDSDSKILAEKEKAIKTLLDSDNVLPPGTETEAIQTIVEKNQQEQEIRNQEDKNRGSRKRSPIYSRLGPKKLSKSPIRLSPLRRERRSPFSPGRRRRSAERDSSVERRLASRRRLREREARFGRRSRSRDRHRSRSRSFERRRSRSGGRRASRSPFERRVRRSRSRSPNRSRRRSPFINELARQFSHEGMLADKPPPMGPMPSYGAVPPPMDPRMLPTPGMPGPAMMNPMHPGPPLHPAGPPLHPSGPPSILPPGPVMGGPRGPPFLGYDGPPSAGPVDYPFNPALMNAVSQPPMTRPLSPVPQPVPAPTIGQPPYAAPVGAPLQRQPPAKTASRDRYSPDASYGNRRSRSPADKFRNRTMREERMKTPEPPIISDAKPNEKASLSSLLEASVTSKDVSSTTSSSKGYRPEILKHCEKALRSLPTEDPRLKLKGRFFFDPLKKDDEKKDKPSAGSNSILLRKGRTEIQWEEEQEQSQAPASGSLQALLSMRRVVTHPKYCQTEETTRDDASTQAEETPTPKADFSQQVGPSDLMPPKEEPRRQPAMMVEENRRVPPIDDMRRPAMEENRRVPPIDDMRRPAMEENRRVPPIDDMRRPAMEENRRVPPIEDMRRPAMEENRRAPAIEDMRRPAMEENRRPAAIEEMRRPAMEQEPRRALLGDRLDWSMRETFDHGADRLRDNDQDMRWNSGGSVGSNSGSARPVERTPWSRGFSPKPIDHMHGNAAPMSKPVDNNYMRGERDVDLRDRDMESRMLELMRERERLRGNRGVVGGMGGAGGAMDDYSTRRQQVPEDYDFRKLSGYGGGGGGGGAGGPGSIDSFNRAMEMMERERNEQEHGIPSPIPDDPDDELEIIEERNPWQPRAAAPAVAASVGQFGNARGGGNVNRSFRGRLGGYRNY